jgi:phage FluMu protein Com
MASSAALTKYPPLMDWRCQATTRKGRRCGRLLARVAVAEGVIEQKCECGAMNVLQVGQQGLVATIRVELH